MLVSFYFRCPGLDDTYSRPRAKQDTPLSLLQEALDLYGSGAEHAPEWARISIYFDFRFEPIIIEAGPRDSAGAPRRWTVTTCAALEYVQTHFEPMLLEHQITFTARETM